MNVEEEGASVFSLVPWERQRRRPGRLVDLRAVLEAHDLPQRVAAASEMEVYFAAKSLGAEDAPPLLNYATPAQCRALWDLEVWDRGQLALADLLTWLAAFREAGTEALLRATRSLDPEAAAAALARRLHITLKPPEDDTPGPSEGWQRPAWLEDPSLEVSETPDGRFYIAPRIAVEDDPDQPIDEEEQKAVMAWVADTYRSDAHEDMAALLRLAEADLPSDLEETAYRFRNARLEDLGFPPYERALEVYSPVDPEAELSRAWENWGRAPDVRLPTRYVEALESSMLAGVLKDVPDVATLERLEGELLPLVHGVLVADRIDVAAEGAVREAVARVAGILAVALQAPLGVRTAQERLAHIPLRMLFRAGHSLLLRLKGRAVALRSAPLYPFLESADQAALEVLSAVRPRFPEGLETHPEPLDPARAGMPRAFRGWQDVEQAQHYLERLEGLDAAERSLGLGVRIQALAEPIWPADVSERTLRRALTTGAVWVALGRPFGFEGLGPERLADAADWALTLDPKDWAARVEGGLSQVSPLTDAARDALRWTVRTGLKALQEELRPTVGKERVDPRFVDAVFRQPVDP